MGVLSIIIKIVAILFFLALAVWCFCEGDLSTMIIPFVVGLLVVIRPVREFLFGDVKFWLLAAPLIGVVICQRLFVTERLMGIILGVVLVLFTFLIAGNFFPVLGEFAETVIAGLSKGMLLPVAIPIIIVLILFAVIFLI